MSASTTRDRKIPVSYPSQSFFLKFQSALIQSLQFLENPLYQIIWYIPSFDHDRALSGTNGKSSKISRCFTLIGVVQFCPSTIPYQVSYNLFIKYICGIVYLENYVKIFTTQQAHDCTRSLQAKYTNFLFTSSWSAALPTALVSTLEATVEGF